jgi:hypothetical protein
MRDNVVKLHTEPNIKVRPILPDALDGVIDRAIEIMRPAIERRGVHCSVDYVVDELRCAQSFLWLVYVDEKLSAAFTTCIVSHPSRDNLKVEFMGGRKMNVWGEYVIKMLVELAKNAKLDGVEADGRKGFNKYARAASFREIYTHYEMELT